MVWASAAMMLQTVIIWLHQSSDVACCEKRDGFGCLVRQTSDSGTTKACKHYFQSWIHKDKHQTFRLLFSVIETNFDLLLFLEPSKVNKLLCITMHGLGLSLCRGVFRVRNVFFFLIVCPWRSRRRWWCIFRPGTFSVEISNGDDCRTKRRTRIRCKMLISSPCAIWVLFASQKYKLMADCCFVAVRLRGGKCLVHL